MGCVHGTCNFRRRRRRGQTPANSSSRHVIPGGGHVIAGPTLGSVHVPSHNLSLQFASLSHRGHYPDSPDRENQDSFLIQTNLLSNPNLHLFAVFDGHGIYGAECAKFVRDRLPEHLCTDPVTLLADPTKAFNSAFLAINSELHRSSEIDDSMSGTTAIAVLVHGDTLYVANVGDSRAVAGVLNGELLLAEDLSSDQTPFREDERERVQKCGARVLTAGQVEAAAIATADGSHLSETEKESTAGGVHLSEMEMDGEAIDDEGDPPRLWVRDAMYPGTAFTRSVGDLTAEGIGVIADPEVRTVRISPHHLFFVIASDGVFEFLSSQAVVDMVSQFPDPRDACSEIAAESYRLWLQNESRTDDITLIIVHIKDLFDPGSFESHQVIQTRVKDGAVTFRKLPEASAELDSLHSDSSMERRLSCVAPSPTHPIH